MATTDFSKKLFLDYEGLQTYDELIKEYIKTGSTDEIAKVIEDLAAISTAVTNNTESISNVQNAVNVLNSDETVEGSVDKKIKKAIDDLVNGAPEALDTLKEIASWIKDDETGTTTLVSRVTSNEEKITELETKNELVYNSIEAIPSEKIQSLFSIIQEENPEEEVLEETTEEEETNSDSE